jgi:DNA polymerase III sliding clamp (beta) subunit (PCNA family)
MQSENEMRIVKAVKLASKGTRKGSRVKIQIIGQSLSYSDGDHMLRVGLEDNQATELNYSSVGEYELSAYDERTAPLSRVGWDFTADRLCQALSWCAMATDTEATRYALGGVCWDGIHLVATDGRRMHVVRLGENYHDGSAIIPVRFVQAVCGLVKLFKDDIVSIRITDNEIVACGDVWQLCSRLVEGRFPNWRQIVDIESEPQVAFIRQLGEHADAIVKRTKLENKVAVEGLSAKSRKAYDEKTPELLLGESKVNAEYIRDAIAIIDNATCEYFQNDPKNSSAILIGDKRIVDGNGYSTAAIVMPMK